MGEVVPLSQGKPSRAATTPPSSPVTKEGVIVIGEVGLHVPWSPITGKHSQIFSCHFETLGAEKLDSFEEKVTIEIHTLDGEARGFEILLALLSALQPFSKPVR